MTLERFVLIAAIGLSSFAGGATSTLLVSAPLGAQATSPVTTEQVNVVDRSGRLRAILSGEDEAGMASLAILDEAGRRRAVVAADRAGSPMVQLYDASEALRLLAAVQDDQPVVLVTGTDNQRAVLGTITGSPALTFAEGQQPRTQVGVTGDGLPVFQMFGRSGQAQLIAHVDDSAQPLVTLRDQDGRSRASLGVVRDSAVLNLSDRTAPRIVLGVATDGTPSLAFVDEKGTPTHRIP